MPEPTAHDVVGFVSMFASMVAALLAMTLSEAKNLAIACVVVLVVLALLMAKNIAGISRKLLTIIVFAALTFGVWTQRQSLQRCADRVRTTGGVTQTCRFFGSEITIHGREGARASLRAVSSS